MEGKGEMKVMSLRLPYIFGTMPGRDPLWKMFLSQIQGKAYVPVLGGETAMVTTQQVAEAAVGAFEHGDNEATYAISGANMKYKDFYQIFAVLGQTETDIVSLDTMKPGYAQADQKAAEEGKEHGILNAVVAEIQNRDAYLDPAATMPILQYNQVDICICQLKIQSNVHSISVHL